MDWMIYTVNTLYYISLLLMIGAVLNEGFIFRQMSEKLQLGMINSRVWLSRILLVLTVVTIFEQVIQWIEQFGKNDLVWKQLFLETATGQIWIVLLVLAFVGTFIQKSKPIILMIWVLLIALFESMNGHAAASDWKSLATLFDFIHLLCGSIWVGGLFLFVALWRHHSEDLKASILRFSSLIWVSILLLSISGTIMTILYIPSWTYLLYTAWGKWLIVKVLLVCGGLVCGMIVRNKLKQKQYRIFKTLLIEAIIMVFVMVAATCISLISPMPNTTPLNVHKMGDELHYTVQISPKAPGPNSFYLKLWTLEKEGKPNSVQLELSANSKPNQAAKVYSLSEIALDEPYDFEGFEESRYQIDDFSLPYPDQWHGKITIVYESGFEREFTFTFENK